MMNNNINENILFPYHIVITPTKEFQPEYRLHWYKLKEVFEKLCTTQQMVKAMIFEMTEDYIWLAVILPKGYHRNLFVNTLKKQSYEYLSELFPELPCVLNRTCWSKEDWAKSLGFIDRENIMKYINNNVESSVPSPNVA